MKHRTDNTPHPYYHDHTGARTKNWTSPSSCLTPRSSSRSRPYNRADPVYLTKTRPLRPNPTNPSNKPHPPNCARRSLNPSRRMRWTKPNPTTKNPSLLINCPPWLNNPHPTILPLTHPSNSPYLLYHNILSLSCFQTEQSNKH